ncbi:MAG: hypothetical protein M3Q42_11880 [Pseudomonadota bacterium]|nr:hypothetical protein [Pseudomonadota bacterium]
MKALAAGCGVSERTLNTWVKRGCPRSSIRAALSWRDKHVLPRKGGPRKARRGAIEEAEDTELQGLQARRTLAQCLRDEEAARSAKMKNDLLAGTLVPIDQVVRDEAVRCTQARSILEGLSDAIAKELPEEWRARTHAAAKTRIEAVLRKLSTISAPPLPPGDGHHGP